MQVVAGAESAKPSHWARLRAWCRLLPWALAALHLLTGAASATPMVGAYADLAAQPSQIALREVKRLAEEGARSVRLPLDWNRVEPEAGKFSWKKDDAVVNAARAAGLDVVLVLGPCAVWAVHPAWQVPPQQKPRSVPRSLAPWERYVQAAVKHFKGRVTQWQIREQPNSRNFRGARSEYLRLLVSGARAARAADAKAEVVMPEAGALRIAAAARMLGSEERSAWHVLGLYLPAAGRDLSASALAWAVLTHEVLGELPRRRPPVWVLGADAVLPADLWVRHYLLACAFGVERLYLPAQTISRSWLAPLSGLRYLGFLRLGPEVWALVFEDPQGLVAAVWSLQETEIPAADLAPVLDPEALASSAPVGGAAGAAVRPEGESFLLRLGPRPVLLRGLDLRALTRAGAPRRADVLAGRPGPDPAGAGCIYVNYDRSECPEFGLYNQALRDRVGGRVEEEVHGDRRCLCTRLDLAGGGAELGAPWMFFDVDDRWLYFPPEKTRVAITVECRGSYLGERQLGFNILYDSKAGYRFTPWQWVAPGEDWHRYRFELDDVSFAGGNGYDFRINALGSKQDLWVAEVTVEKLPSG